MTSESVTALGMFSNSRSNIRSSFVFASMGRRLRIDPILFLPRHPVTAGNSSSGAGPVQRTGLGTVTKRLKAVLLPPRTPLVEDHLDRQPAAPDVTFAVGLVGFGGETAMFKAPGSRLEIQISERSNDVMTDSTGIVQFKKVETAASSDP